MGFQSMKGPSWNKTMFKQPTIKQIQNFSYLECDVSFDSICQDIKYKTHRF